MPDLGSLTSIYDRYVFVEMPFFSFYLGNVYADGIVCSGLENCSII